MSARPAWTDHEKAAIKHYADDCSRAFDEALEIVPREDHAMFYSFAIRAATGRLDRTNEPIRNVHEYFHDLAHIYLDVRPLRSFR